MTETWTCVQAKCGSDAQPKAMEKIRVELEKPKAEDEEHQTEATRGSDAQHVGQTEAPHKPSQAKSKKRAVTPRKAAKEKEKRAMTARSPVQKKPATKAENKKRAATTRRPHVQKKPAKMRA